jgi:hypothetical protein
VKLGLDWSGEGGRPKMGIEIGPPKKMRSENVEKWYPGKFVKEWQPLIPRKKILGELMGVIRVDMEEVDHELERMFEDKAREWRAKHYPEKLIAMAHDLADSWAKSMAEAFAPAEAPEIRKAIIKHVYPKALHAADQWITKMGEAALSMQRMLQL